MPPEGIYYQALAGMKPDMSGVRTTHGAAATAASSSGGPQRQQQQEAAQPADAEGAEPADAEPETQRGAPIAPDSPAGAQAEDGGGGADAAALAGAAGGDIPKPKKRVTFADELSDGEGSSGSGSSSEGGWEERPRLTREQLREQRREHKKEVKAANQERRKGKVPKHVKKRATKANKKK